MTTESNVKEVVREKYGQAAQRVAAGQANGCCGASALEGCDPITSDLYDTTQAGEVPEKALQASLGCGNPTALDLSLPHSLRPPSDWRQSPQWFFPLCCKTPHHP